MGTEQEPKGQPEGQPTKDQPGSIIWRDIEAFAVFCICVAGKRGRATEKRVECFLSKRGEALTPFRYIRWLIDRGRLERALREVRMGQYGKITRALTEIVEACYEGKLDLWTCGVEDLEAIHGIGPKTSRYFLLRTRENPKVAALDVHVLHWLHDLGYDVPKHTPQSGKQYRRVEAIFLEEADKRGTDPGELDRQVWHKYSAGVGEIAAARVGEIAPARR